jgi:hypothetical protein
VKRWLSSGTLCRCSLVEIERRFRRAYCLHKQGEEDKNITSVLFINFMHFVQRARMRSATYVQKDLLVIMQTLFSSLENFKRRVPHTLNSRSLARSFSNTQKKEQTSITRRKLNSHEKETTAARFQASMKMTVFWDTAPCGLEETDGRFRSACYFHHQGPGI